MGTPRIAYGGLAVFLGILFLGAQAWVVASPGLDTPAGATDLGIPFLPTDHAQYQMVAQQGRAGSGPFHANLYTTESQDGRFLMLGLTAVGWVQHVVPANDRLAWETLRLFAVAVLVLVLWLLCVSLFQTRGRALVAFAGLLFAGGLDAVARGLAGAGMLGAYTPDSWMANPWNFSVFWAAVVATWVWPLGIIGAMVLLEVRHPTPLPIGHRGDPGRNTRRVMGRSLLRGLAFALLWAVHPYSAMAWGVLVAWASIVPVPGSGALGSRILERVRVSLPAILGPLIVLAYIIWARQDPVYAASSDQVRLWRLWYLPHLWLPAYGPQILLAILGMLPRSLMSRVHDGKDYGQGFAWIRAWALVALVLSCNPLVTGVKFQFLATVPLGLLAARGAFLLWDRFVPRPSRPLIPAVVAVATIAILSSSGMAGLITDIRDQSNREASWSADSEVAALAALGELPDGGVLCHPRTGLLVPWKAGKPVFVGHWFLSTRYQEKAVLVHWFFNGPALPDQRLSFLRDAGIRWILHGPREAAFGPVPDLEGLVQTWQSGAWSIFEFTGS